MIVDVSLATTMQSSCAVELVVSWSCGRSCLGEQLGGLTTNANLDHTQWIGGHICEYI